MKKLIIILAIFFISCSTDEIEQSQPEQICYTILAKGYDERGNFIIIKYESFNNRRYKVNNYLDYVGKNTICDLSNLTEQSL